MVTYRNYINGKWLINFISHATNINQQTSTSTWHHPSGHSRRSEAAVDRPLKRFLMEIHPRVPRSHRVSRRTVDEEYRKSSRNC